MGQHSVIARERYEQTTTFDEYVERMQVNQQQMTEFTDEIEISDDDIEWWQPAAQSQRLSPHLRRLRRRPLQYPGIGQDRQALFQH